MKRIAFSVVLLCMVLCIAMPAFPATYCLRADGTAGSKTAATDCLTVSNCMDVGDHDGETFAINDEILVCAHGGEFDSTLTPQSSGTSGNEILYTGVPNGTDIPTFDDGYDGNSQDFLIVQGIIFESGVSESGVATFEGGRFADETRSWQAAEETAVTGWQLDDAGIFAVGIGGTGGATTPTPQLYWRDKTDAGSFAAVGATGEVKYTTVSGLTDESDVTSGEAGVSSGKSYVTCVTCEQENSHQATSSTSLATNEWGELQVGVSFADADEGHEYEFSLYESAAQVGSASVATVTTLLGYCSSCAHGEPCDVICEDAEGSSTVTDTGFDTSWCGDSIWNEYTDGVNTIVEAAHTGTLSCTDKGNYAIEFDMSDDGDGGEACKLKDEISNQSYMKVQLYFALKSRETWESTEYSGIVSGYADGNYQLWMLVFTHGGSNETDIGFAYCDTDDTCDQYTTMTRKSDVITNISAGTWYRAQIIWNQNDSSDGVLLYIDGVVEFDSDTDGSGEGSNTRQTVNQGADDFNLGAENASTSIGSGDGIIWQVDRVCHDDDGSSSMGACPS